MNPLMSRHVTRIEQPPAAVVRIIHTVDRSGRIISIEREGADIARNRGICARQVHHLLACCGEVLLEGRGMGNGAGSTLEKLREAVGDVRPWLPAIAYREPLIIESTYLSTNPSTKEEIMADQEQVNPAADAAPVARVETIDIWALRQRLAHRNRQTVRLPNGTRRKPVADRAGDWEEYEGAEVH